MQRSNTPGATSVSLPADLLDTASTARRTERERSQQPGNTATFRHSLDLRGRLVTHCGHGSGMPGNELRGPRHQAGAFLHAPNEGGAAVASGLYASFRQSLLSGGIDLTSADIRAILIDNGAYTVNLAAHATLTDVPAGARISVSGSLASKTVTGGVFDAADTLFSAVTGATTEAVLLYKHTGTDGTSSLLAYIDGVALTPNGSSATVQWDNGANKIFAL